MEPYSQLAMACPKGLTISQTIRWLRRRWHTVKIGWSRVRANQINNGSCGEFATTVIGVMGWNLPKHLRTDLDYCGNGVWPGHYFIEVDGLFYDSESPDGVANWKELAIFKRYIRKQTV